MLIVANKSIKLSVIMLHVVMLSVVMLSVIMLSVVMLSVVMLSVIMLSVVAPFITPFQLHPLYCIIIKKPVVPLTLIVSWFVPRRILDFSTGIDYMIGGGIYGQVSAL
jgi:hypothetical protein